MSLGLKSRTGRPSPGVLRSPRPDRDGAAWGPHYPHLRAGMSVTDPMTFSAGLTGWEATGGRAASEAQGATSADDRRPLESRYCTIGLQWNASKSGNYDAEQPSENYDGSHSYHKPVTGRPSFSWSAVG